VAYGAVLHGTLRGIVLQYLVDPDGMDLESAKKAALWSLQRTLGPGIAVTS